MPDFSFLFVRDTSKTVVVALLPVRSRALCTVLIILHSYISLFVSSPSINEFPFNENDRECSTAALEFKLSKLYGYQ